MKPSSTSLLAACLICGSQTGHTQIAEIAADEVIEIEEIRVIAHPLSGEGLAQPTTSLGGEQLKQNLSASIGETLARQPGISSASFGQAVGRPVIHGLGGARVRIMEDRIDTMDASATSADHASTVEPFIADRIEVLKGASTLLYGNGAIGGVVDVHTGRIPHRVPERASGRAELRGADNADQRTVAGVADLGTGLLALHLDGFYRQANAYQIPGFAESRQLRELEDDGPDTGATEASGILPGSDVETSGGAVGGSLVGERGFFGVALSRYRSDYGLPGGHGEDEPDGQAGYPRIDLDQTRVDLEAALADPFEHITSLNLRLGFNNYEHAEIEPSGELGTLFENDALDARIELSHAALAGVSGTAGLQFGDRDFSAIGEEAFVPPVQTRTQGLFWLGERLLPALELEAGLRYEHLEHQPDQGRARTFDLLAASVGAVIPLGEAWSIGALLDYANRAPVAEELYSNGPHLVTRAFELGDPGLDEERAVNVSASLGYAGERYTLGATAYYHGFDNFIYQSATGEVQEDLIVLQWTQADAAFYGVDLEGSVTAVRFNRGDLVLRAFYDQVRARLAQGENRNLPRIPPQRFGLGATWRWRLFTASIDYSRVSEQDRVTEYELPTDGYEDLRLYLGARFPMGASELELFLSGRNLTNDEQRYHTSFIKDFAPQPGRAMEAGIRLTL